MPLIIHFDAEFFNFIAEVEIEVFIIIVNLVADLRFIMRNSILLVPMLSIFIIFMR